MIVKQPTPTRLCKDCIHFKPNVKWVSHEYRIKYGLCTNPLISGVDPVTGDMLFNEAHYVRRDEEQCGVIAKLYQEKLDCGQVHDVVVVVDGRGADREREKLIENISVAIAVFVLVMILVVKRG